MAISTNLTHRIPICTSKIQIIKEIIRFHSSNSQKKKWINFFILFSPIFPFLIGATIFLEVRTQTIIKRHKLRNYIYYCNNPDAAVSSYAMILTNVLSYTIISCEK